MKKFFYCVLCVCVVAWAGILPAHAAPMRQAPDPIIECDDPQCTQVSDTLIKIEMQFHYDPANGGQGRGGWFFLNEESDLYYMTNWSVTYSNGSGWATTAWPRLVLPGAAGYDGQYENGQYQVGGYSSVTMTGALSQVSASPVAAGHYLAQANFLETPDVSESGSGSFILYISAEPISNCDTYVEISTDTYEIDPTIEFPLGPAGTPPDYQTYNTTIDQVYRLSISGGPWNDGTDDREDVAISWDGILWTPLAEIPPFCVEQALDGSIANYFLAAESEVFYIRVNDEAGQFEDNTNNPDPLSYTITMTSLSLGAGCDSQFAYDEFTDVIGFTSVDATDNDGALLSNDEPLVVGEWYVVKWGYGEWTDGSDPAERIDVEYAWLPHVGWEDLNSEGDAGSAVWCKTTGGIETLIQAQATNIFLRANDQDSNFANNNGEVYYTIYHATFDRKPEPCELIVDMGSLIEAIEVDADKWLGSPVGTALEKKIVPGQWYVLDTTLGPWGTVGGSSSRYDMAIQKQSIWTDIVNPWEQLEDFEASCNVATDTLGHRRIIFQAPNDYGYSTADNPNLYPNGVYYRMRVDREFLGLYNGSMGWQLFGATEKQNVTSTCLDGLNLQVINEFTRIDEKNQMGEMLLSNSPRWPELVALVPGVTYVVQSPVQTIDQCAGDPGSGCKFQISNDGGQTWYAVDDQISPIECAVKEDAPSTIWRARFVAQEGEIWKIRVNDMDGNFVNNDGYTGFKLFKDCSGQECIPIPESQIPAISIQGGGNVCNIPIMRPAPLTLSEISNLGTYLGSWIRYLDLSMLRYMAWCDRHTNILRTMMLRLETREPFASVIEVEDIADRVKDEVKSYDWGSNAGTGESIFDTVRKGEFATKMTNRIFGKGRERSVWEGGDVISFSNTSLPPSYYSCGTAFTNVLPSGIRNGVCFVSAYFIETSASFWIQLMIDIGALILAVKITTNAISDAVYLFTGVRYERASLSGVRRAVEANERSEAARRQEAVDEDAEILRNRLGGSYRRNRDGSYSRR